MATTPLFSHFLFTLPFSHATDFTELADNCERFVEGLVECHDPVEKLRFVRACRPVWHYYNQP